MGGGGGCSQDPGDPGVRKVRGKRFFSFKQGEGELTLDDTMNFNDTMFFILLNDALLILPFSFLSYQISS